MASTSHSDAYGKFVSIIGYIKSSGSEECAKPKAWPNSCLTTVSSAAKDMLFTSNIVTLDLRILPF